MGNRADAMLAEGLTVLFCFEEAIGFMVGSVVLDKDGVSAAAVAGEMANAVYARGSTLSAQLESVYDRCVALRWWQWWRTPPCVC